MSEHADFEEQLGLVEALDQLSALHGNQPQAPRTILLLAFKGWNDAAEAATGVLSRLRHRLSARKIAHFSDEKYFDYQVLRPVMRRKEDGERSIRWPSLRVYEAARPFAGQRLLIAYGNEPSFRWRSFADEMMAFVTTEQVDAVVLFGAMLADAPHTRPLPTFTSSEDKSLRRYLGLESSSYEGPTGMIGVLSEKFRRAALPTISAWVSVPHYVSQAPSPKAQLAIIEMIEEIFGVVWDDSELKEAAERWEESVNELASSDEEIAEYVHKLERALDAATDSAITMQHVSGESIAKEFEQYLREQSPRSNPQHGQRPEYGDPEEKDPGASNPREDHD